MSLLKMMIQNFNQVGIPFEQDEDSFNLSFSLRKKYFLKAMDTIGRESSFRLLDILALEEEGQSDLLLVYHFFYTESFEYLRIKVKCGEDQKMPSVVHLWNYAHWYERELYDSYKIATTNNPSHLFFFGNTSWALEKNSFPSKLETKVKRRLSLSEFHSLDLLENGYMEEQFRLEGKKIVEARFNLGFEHQGIEKLCEGQNLIYPLSLLHYINTAQAPLFSHLYCNILEKLFNIEVPKRAQFLRMIVSELVRIQDHIKTFSMMARTLDVSGYESLLSSLVFEIYVLLQDLCPVRTDGFRYSCPGGVFYDISNDWGLRCLRTLNFVERELSSWKNVMLKSVTLRDQLSGDCLSKKDAIDLNLSGPLLRACGINYDIRKANPYDLYAQLDFEVPLGLYGSGYDRFLVRLEEVLESTKIIYQLLNNLPTSKTFKIKEGFTHFFSNEEPQVKDIYFAHEGPSGELGYYLCLGKNGLIKRLKVHTSSFDHAQAFEKVIIGRDVEDAHIIQGSFNFSIGEVER